MSELVKAYCDGAYMAYRDCANKITDMVMKAPPELKDIMEGLMPLAQAMILKSEAVHGEADSFLNGARQ